MGYYTEDGRVYWNGRETYHILQNISYIHEESTITLIALTMTTLAFLLLGPACT